MAEEPSAPIPGNGNVLVYKVDELKRQVEANERTIADLCKQVADLTVVVARMSERLTIFQFAQGMFTTIIGSIAAILGRLP